MFVVDVDLVAPSEFDSAEKEEMKRRIIFLEAERQLNTSPPAAHQIFESIVRDETTCHQLNGLSPNEINQILSELSKNQDQQISPAAENNRQPPFLHHHLSQMDRLILFLIWMRHYPLLSFLAAFTKLSIETVRKAIICTAIELDKYYPSTVNWPSDEKLSSIKVTQDQFPAEVERVCCIADGTRFPISRPVDEEIQR